MLVRHDVATNPGSHRFRFDCRIGCVGAANLAKLNQLPSRSVDHPAIGVTRAYQPSSERHRDLIRAIDPDPRLLERF
jgi:hypothetical protein